MKTRSLKELFNVVKENHFYWNRDSGLDNRFMCHAAEATLSKGKITLEEYNLVMQRIRLWLIEIDHDRYWELMIFLDFREFPPVADMLGLSHVEDEIEIKEWWETKFNELESLG